MHKGSSAFSGEDRLWAKDIAERLERIERYTRYLVSFLPEDKRVPPDQTEDSPPEVVSVGQMAEQASVDALVERLRELEGELDRKALTEPVKHRSKK